MSVIPSSFRKYLAIIKITYMSVLENRWQILIANLQAAFTLFILFYFWQAVFRNQTTFNGYTFSQIITYYFLVRVTYNRTTAFSAATVSKLIRSGDITKYLVRPYDFTIYYTCQFFTRATLWTFGNLITIFIFSLYFARYLIIPQSLLSWTLFFIVFVFNGLLSIAINLNIGYIAFWIGEITHLKLVSSIVITIFSGGLIPLTFFPSWFQQLSWFLPFRFLVQFPTDIYFDRLDIFSSLTGLAQLVLWVAGFYLLANHTLHRGLRSYESYN